MSVLSTKIKVQGSKQEMTLEALFDSGASDSIIKSEYAYKLGNPDNLPYPLSFEIASENQDITISKRIGLDFYIDNNRLMDEFLLFDNLSEDMIIGASTMQKYRMKLDFDVDKVTVDPKVTKKILKKIS